MGDDEEEQFSVEDIVAFKEQDLREYAPAVQLYFGEAMRLRAPAGDAVPGSCPGACARSTRPMSCP